MQEKAATYRDVFAVKEYRHLFGAHVLSLVGDQLSAVALAVLVYATSNSPVLAAASFASTYLAWIVGGPLLSTFADRLPRRAVMITCDLVRAALFLVLALQALPPVVVVLIAFVGHLFHAPFLAARAALVPEILEGDRYTVANGLDNLFMSVGQIAGFALGGVLLTMLPVSQALMLDAATFVGSALFIAYGVRRRPAAAANTSDDSIATGGFRLIFGDRTLRAYVLLLWIGCGFVFAPEGIMITLSSQYGHGSAITGLLLAAAPVGGAIGSVFLTRMCQPARRMRLIVPLAVLSVAVLMPVMVRPPIEVVLLLLVVAGFANAYCVPLNPLFGRAIPNEYRGRAFGIAVSGLSAAQGFGMLGAGLLAEHFAATTVIAMCGVAGTICVGAVALVWPRHEAAATPVNTRVLATAAS